MKNETSYVAASLTEGRLHIRRGIGWAFLVTLIVHLLMLCVASLAHAEVPSDRLIAALIMQESSGRNTVIGDKNLSNKAHGCLQVRQDVCDDVNRKYGTKYRPVDCQGNRPLSIKICRLYLGIWATKAKIGRTPTDEDCARIWNGGPKGYAKSVTKGYWVKIQGRLRQLENA